MIGKNNVLNVFMIILILIIVVLQNAKNVITTFAMIVYMMDAKCVLIVLIKNKNISLL